MINITKLFDLIKKERHHLIMDEVDVIDALKVINKHHKIVPDMAVGNCGWANGDENKWFIHFITTKIKWDTIRKELNVVRVFTCGDIPEKSVGIIYSDD